MLTIIARQKAAKVLSYEGISIKLPATLLGDVPDALSGARRPPGLLPIVVASNSGDSPREPGWWLVT